MGQAEKDDQWALYRRENDPALRDKEQRQEKKSSAQTASPVDWEARQQQARKRMDNDHLLALAEHLGVPAAAIDRLAPGIAFVAWDEKVERPEPSYSWPMVDGAGRYCGLHARHKQTGQKKAVHGARLGAIAPAGWRQWR
jgi:hypothetical protein